METGQLIGEGGYRKCYTTDSPDLCVKRMKSNIIKHYFGFNFNFNMKMYLRIKFGISDMNQLEFDQIKKLPESLKAYIPSNIGLTREGLMMGRPKDYNGEYSRNVIEIGKIRNEFFWNCVDEICEVFEQNNLWFHDVFFKGNNLLVKKISEDKFIPIMIDLKEIGKTLSPIQFNLIFRSEQKRKFYRRLNQFKTKYYTKT